MKMIQFRKFLAENILLTEAGIERVWKDFGPKISQRMRSEVQRSYNTGEPTYIYDRAHDLVTPEEAHGDMSNYWSDHGHKKLGGEHVMHALHKDMFADEVDRVHDDIGAPKGQYNHWIARQYAQGHIKQFEDIGSQVADVLQKHRAIVSKPTLAAKYGIHKDIAQYEYSHTRPRDPEVDYMDPLPNPKSIHAALDKVPEEEWRPKDPSAVEAENKVSKYEDEHWHIYVPHTEEASQKYGAGTKWCTAARNNCMFDGYNNRGHLHIFVPKVPQYEGEKYQLHGSHTFMDETDRSVSLNTLHAAEHGRPSSYALRLKSYYDNPSAANLDHSDPAIVRAGLAFANDSHLGHPNRDVHLAAVSNTSNHQVLDKEIDQYKASEDKVKGASTYDSDLYDDGRYEHLNAIQSNKHLTVAHWERLKGKMSEPDANYGYELFEPMLNNKGGAEYIAKHASVDVKKHLTTETPSALLHAALHNDADHTVRAAVAQETEAHHATQMHDPHPKVRAAVASYSTSDDVLDRLAKDPHPTVREEVPAVGRGLVLRGHARHMQLVNDPHPDVARAGFNAIANQIRYNSGSGSAGIMRSHPLYSDLGKAAETLFSRHRDDPDVAGVLANSSPNLSHLWHYAHNNVGDSRLPLIRRGHEEINAHIARTETGDYNHLELMREGTPKVRDTLLTNRSLSPERRAQAKGWTYEADRPTWGKATAMPINHPSETPTTSQQLGSKRTLMDRLLGRK